MRRSRLTGTYRMCMTVACTGVGISGIDDDRLCPMIRQVLFCHQQRIRLHLIARINGRTVTGRGRNDQRQIFLRPGFANAAVHRSGRKAVRRTDAPLYFFHIICPFRCADQPADPAPVRCSCSGWLLHRRLFPNCQTVPSRSSVLFARRRSVPADRFPHGHWH